jgi:hypothetical protein
MTPCSERVNGNAVRLFLHGYVMKLHEVEGSNGTVFTIPSETEPGTVYVLQRNPVTDEISCACPAGRWARACKHLRLLECVLGLTIPR